MTRAKNAMALVRPLRFYVRGQSRYGDRHVFVPRTRFVPEGVVGLFERVSPVAVQKAASAAGAVRVDVAARLRANWG
jgi:DNA helicase II / ATP-dependent DNA helicase PcrA